MAGQLEVKWQTGTLPNNGWVVRQNVQPELATRFAALLFGLNQSEQGRAMLARLPISKFEAATDTTYRPVQEYLKIFSATVRHIEY